jgi:hypothetical protein
MSPQQLMEGNAQLWGRRGRRYSVEGGQGPTAAPCSLQGCTAPPTGPRSQACSPGPEGRGRPPLVGCLKGKEERRGEKPKVGLAEGLPGNSTTLA